MEAVRPRRTFATLDAIRGIAALCVMGFHYALLDNGLPLRFGNAFIDVDLFFCLSGFVLMQAYGDWADRSLGVLAFLKLRLVRLYPMYIVGTAVGVLAFLASPAAGQVSGGSLILSLLSALLLLPDVSGAVLIPLGIPDGIYPFDLPAWSLFFELLANVALSARRWNRTSLVAVAAVAGAALVAVAVATRTINGGFEPSTLLIGLLRVSYSFTVGALLMKLYRSGLVARFALPPAVPVAAVGVLSAALPVNSRLDVGAVVFAMPLLIAVATRDPRSRWGLSACAWLGRISYPLYAIHYPLVLLAVQHQGRHVGRPWIMGGCAILAVALADLLSRTLDPMLRRALSRAFLRRAALASA